jgi:predicted amidohydrolase
MVPTKAGVVQFQHFPGEKEQNLSILRDFVHQAADWQIDLLVFPEMCITGYWHVRNLSKDEIGGLAEPVPGGPSSEALRELAVENSITVCAGLIEAGDDGNYYNTYVAAMSDGSCAKHRKLHCFISEHMESGNTYTVFTTPEGSKIGILICYDNNIIENARITALKGAEILLAPHQTGGCNSASPRGMKLIDPKLWENRKNSPEAIEAEFRGPNGREWLLRWLPSRAHDNGFYLLFSNGVGIDDNEVRTGNAMIISPYGEILAETWKAENVLVTAGLDPGELPMCTGRRWIRSRRPDLYGAISMPTGLEEDTRKVRFGK